MSLLSDTEIQTLLETHSDWSRKGNEINRTFVFNDFSESMAFTTRVALASETADHHPDIDIRWNKVTLTLSTHSEGGLTLKDFDLADVCDHLLP